jgi:hypothetical protein
MGPNFAFQSQTPFSSKWWSHVFNGPAIRHETAICIQTGHIVWMHGPFPCGEWSDVRVAGDVLIPSLDAIEGFVADKGCLDGS